MKLTRDEQYLIGTLIQEYYNANISLEDEALCESIYKKLKLSTFLTKDR